MTHSYNDPIELLIKLAMERDTLSHMDKHLCRHLRSITPAERNLRARSSQLHSNLGKGLWVQLKHMQETPLSHGKAVLHPFYYRCTRDKGEIATPMTVMVQALASSNY